MAQGEIHSYELPGFPTLAIHARKDRNTARIFT
jgi:hypothetical protein